MYEPIRMAAKYSFYTREDGTPDATPVARMALLCLSMFVGLNIDDFVTPCDIDRQIIPKAPIEHRLDTVPGQHYLLSIPHDPDSC